MTYALNAENVRFGHVSEDTALVVEDYPYGFKLRTSIRYWIETTKHGDRFVSQTLNPKTDRWNKPKKSTYTEIAVLYIEDATGHVKWTGLGHHAKEEWQAHFLAVVGDNLSDSQKSKLAGIIGLKRALEGVTWTVRPVSSDPEERARHDEEQARAGAVIAHRIATETAKAQQEVTG